MNMTHDRASKYIVAARDYMQHVGHSTNAELIAILRLQYPELSATTVHRITVRMVERGELQFAPNGKDNVMRFDANLIPHDHFICEKCDLLKDAILDEKVRPLIEQAIGDGCSISGSLTVSGMCKKCRKESI